MAFSNSFLQQLTQGRVLGDFPPFSLGNAAKIEHYIHKIVAELQRNRAWLVEADFGHYGSGYASYVPITIGKRDKSDTVTSAGKGRVTDNTTGLLLYVSRLVPYWFYGQGWWSRTWEQGHASGGGSTFLDVAGQAAIDPARWQHDCYRLEMVLTEFRYQLLTPEELTHPAPADLTFIPTELADPPYSVFDCFFYWAD